MLTKLEAYFALVIQRKDYNIPLAMQCCIEAEEQRLPMYLIFPEGADITSVATFPWREGGMYSYRSATEINGIMQQIQNDLQWLRSIGT